MASEAPLLEARDRLLVVGKTGTGKSTWVKAHLGRELAAGRRVLWFDYCDEYSREGAASEHVRLGPLKERVEFDELMEDLSQVGKRRLSLAVVPSKEPREAAEQFAALVDVAEAEGDLLFGADEVGMFGSHCADRLHYLAAQSRHWGVPVILASQAMVDVHARARRQATRLVTFRQTHPADLDAIRELTRDDELTDAVPRLDIGEFRTWRDEQKEKKS